MRKRGGLVTALEFGLTNTVGVHVRTRRAKAPQPGARTQVHLPDTGGAGDFTTETALVTYSSGLELRWLNWCGEDRSPVTVVIKTAWNELRTTVERPPCIDPRHPSFFQSR